MVFYKDSYGINHRSAIPQKLKELANIVCENNYDEVLLPHPRKRYCHDEVHIQCGINNDNVEKITEKRICRCWNYYNKANCAECYLCKFPFKKKNAGDIKILDYEVSTPFSMQGIGKIDWLLDYNGKTFAAEVKHPDSTETIVRMVAEILTYTIGTPYIPAICFFKTNITGSDLSKQYKDYIKYKNNEDFCSIINKTGLKVLCISVSNDIFEILDVDNDFENQMNISEL